MGGEGQPLGLSLLVFILRDGGSRFEGGSQGRYGGMGGGVLSHIIQKRPVIEEALEAHRTY